MVGLEFIVQRKGKLNKHRSPATTAQFKINNVNSDNLESSAPGGELE